MQDEVDQKGIMPNRVRTHAYSTTIQLYEELRSIHDKLKDPQARPGQLNSGKGGKQDLGFSTGRIVRACPLDFLADVQGVAMKALGFGPATDRMFMRTVLHGDDPIEKWIGRHATAHQLKEIEERVQQAVGQAFIDAGIHPFSSYRKPVDVR
jgi:hypothetical protein